MTDAASGADSASNVQATTVTPGLLDAFGLQVLDGRTFTAAEGADPRTTVAIVNVRLARRLWPDGAAVGRRVGIVDTRAVSWLRVVGVAPDVMYGEAGHQDGPSRLTLYLPYARTAPRTMSFVVRANGDPSSLVQPAREALQRVYAAMPVYEVRTMQESRRVTTFEHRFFGTLMGGFAAVALLLACLGVYALLADGARRRVSEIGIRLALGANPRDVVWLFVGQAARIGIIGLAGGLVLAVAVARALSGTVFGVDPFDPTLFAGTGLALLVVAILSAWLPARRASRVDPIEALRAS